MLFSGKDLKFGGEGGIFLGRGMSKFSAGGWEGKPWDLLKYLLVVALEP